jgi:hypothetical protein
MCKTFVVWSLYEIQRRDAEQLRLNGSAKFSTNAFAAQNKLTSVLKWRQFALFVDDRRGVKVDGT